MLRKVVAICGLLLLLTLSGKGQAEVYQRAVINLDKGLGFFAPDLVFGFNLRFTMQNSMGITSLTFSNTIAPSIEAQVRCLRLRLDGFLTAQRFQHCLQMGFSRGDQDCDNTGVSCSIRDVLRYYNFNERFYIGFGQSKPPGNRQRVVSSGNKQFADRSIVKEFLKLTAILG